MVLKWEGFMAVVSQDLLVNLRRRAGRKRSIHPSRTVIVMGQPVWRWLTSSVILMVLVVVLFSSSSGTTFPSLVSAQKSNATRGVIYDGRSLIIHGHRHLLFSGSIHYPRSTPESWPSLIAKAKRGGLNVIQTYVFWNVHEPKEGKFNFRGNYDIVRFIKEVEKHGMWVTLRIGPFIEAEWNFGGFPSWLREVPGILFRTDNEPFKHHMKRFTNMIVDMMKKEKLYASQGGPIIVSQIENEYNTISAAYKEDGVKYVQWAGNMAMATNTGIPWVMCKQEDAPGDVISACNGRNCGDTFKGPNSPNKPTLWTENWTAQYRVFGDPPSQRSAEDLAYSVARFFSKNGTLANYYMYHGGTNFGRTGSSFVLTGYYDEAPLDEYGLYKEPKWGHLKDLHSALRLTRKGLLWGHSYTQNLGRDLQARVYKKPDEHVCVAFLSNNNSRVDTTAKFRGVEYFLPHHSISILPDCKTVVFNTQRVNSQHNARTYHEAKESNKNAKWRMWQERIPTLEQTSVKTAGPQEQMSVAKDASDYLWYTTSFDLEEEDLPMRHDIRPVIQATSLGHALHAFVNGQYIGSGHGTNIDKSFTFQRTSHLKAGRNHITLLGMTIGLPDSGVYLEHRMAGVRRVTILGLNTGTLDLSASLWGHEVGIVGEKRKVYKHSGSHGVKWTKAVKGYQVVWYKRYFDAPKGKDPVAVDMTGMGKGQIWINGHAIGRYWVSYHNPLGLPSQSKYHIPRSYLKPKKNLIVLFEESGGDPERIQVVTVRRDNICTKVSEFHPALVKSWARRNSKIHTVVQDVQPKARLKCPRGKLIRSVPFASYGNPTGACGNFTVGSCHTPHAKQVVEKACLGKASCVLSVKPETYGADEGCEGSTFTLAVQAKCARRKKSDD